MDLLDRHSNMQKKLLQLKQDRVRNSKTKQGKMLPPFSLHPIQAGIPGCCVPRDSSALASQAGAGRGGIGELQGAPHGDEVR